MTGTPQAGLARRLAANTLHASTGRFASLLVWLLVTPPILLALGREGFAVWSLFFAVTGYFSALDFGLAASTVKHVAAARERGEPQVAGAFATLAVLGYVVLAVVWLLVALPLRGAMLDWLRIPAEARDSTGFAFVAGAAVFACSGIANVVMGALQGCGRFDLANLVSLAVAAEQAIGIPLVLHFRGGLEALVVNVGIGWVVGIVLGMGYLGRAELGFRWSTPRRSAVHIGEAVRFGGPIQFTNLFATFHYQLDKILLARFVTLAAVTPYELGMRVVLAAMSPAQLLIAPVLPAAAALHAVADHKRLRELHDRARRYMLAIGVAALATTIGSASRIYTAWLGPGHDDATLALRALAVAVAVTLTGNIGGTVARGVGRTDLEAWVQAAIFIVHLALSLVLIPKWGLAGALAAIVTANVVGTVLLLWLIAATLKWAPGPILLEPLGVPLLAMVAGAGTSYLLDRLLPGASGAAAWATLAIVAAAGTTATCAVIFGTGYLRWGELRQMLLVRGRGATAT